MKFPKLDELWLVVYTVLSCQYTVPTFVGGHSVEREVPTAGVNVVIATTTVELANGRQQ